MAKTAVICFDGGNEYVKIKQLSTILREENVSQAISCKNYDILESLIPLLRISGTKKLILLHEEYNIDKFEAAAHYEYDHLFENVEVLIDFSKYNRLYEATKNNVGTGGEPTAEKGDSEVAFKYPLVFFPINAPIKGANQLINSTLPTLQTAITNNSRKGTYINICSLQCETNGLWAGNAVALCSLLQNGISLVNTKYTFARSWGGIERMIQQQQQIATPTKNDVFITTAMANAIGLKNINQYTPLNITDQGLTGPSQQAWKLGVSILQQPAKNVDESKIEEWEKNQPKKLTFLMQALTSIEWAMRNKGKDIVETDGNNFAQKILEQSGVYEDLATLSKNASNMGFAMVMDAAKLVADAAKDMMEKKKTDSKTGKIVSHQDFDKFAALFDDEKVIVEADR